MEAVHGRNGVFWEKSKKVLLFDRYTSYFWPQKWGRFQILLGKFATFWQKIHFLSRFSWEFSQKLLSVDFISQSPPPYAIPPQTGGCLANKVLFRYCGTPIEGGGYHGNPPCRTPPKWGFLCENGVFSRKVPGLIDFLHVEPPWTGGSGHRSRLPWKGGFQGSVGPSKTRKNPIKGEIDPLCPELRTTAASLWVLYRMTKSDCPWRGAIVSLSM